MYADQNARHHLKSSAAKSLNHSVVWYEVLNCASIIFWTVQFSPFAGPVGCVVKVDRSSPSGMHYYLQWIQSHLLDFFKQFSDFITHSLGKVFDSPLSFIAHMGLYSAVQLVLQPFVSCCAFATNNVMLAHTGKREIRNLVHSVKATEHRTRFWDKWITIIRQIWTPSRKVK